MKNVLAACIIMLVFTGCDEKPKNPVSEYGSAMIGSYQKGQQAAATSNLYAVKSTVQAYRAANGKYPDNLSDLDFRGQKIDLSLYDYDPQTGAVTLKGN